MPNEIFTKMTFDSVEIADFVYRFFVDKLTDEEEMKYRIFKYYEDDYEAYISEDNDDRDEYIKDLANKLWGYYYDYFRGFDDFDAYVNIYRKDNYILFCTAWHPLFEVAEYINKLFNVHVIAEIDEKLSESCDDVIRRVEYNIQNMSK
ncbi:hypothetical protein M9Y10_018236 [Tritrichomonas musculus]|uniref:Uncharacterized protein n=1 Tax=Tritrichomonas musculus TaxID=1915356 RepID=A0ABR2HNB1_9EUKA